MIPSMTLADSSSIDGKVSNSNSVSQSGQHGLFQTFAFGHGSSATPTFTDASGGAVNWLWIGLAALAVGAVAYFLLRKKR